MSLQLDSQVRLEWVIASSDLDADWSHAACCDALAARPPAEPQPPAGDEDAWWPDRCIP
ncbi:MAG TPA: hypothetical protein VJG32_01380 [Anaerolineae bacterium]|nr:hypothetical protein [Anaerolineae bacterium]